MPKYARVQCSFWDDPDILGLSPNAKLVYMWTFTNRACGISGVYRIGLEVARQAVGLNPKDFQAAWAEVQNAGKVIYDPQTGVLWVVGKLKQEVGSARGADASPKTLAGAVNDLFDLPDSPVVASFCHRYEAVLADLPVFERFKSRQPIPHAYPIDGVSPSDAPIPINNNININNPCSARSRGRRLRRNADYTEGFQRWFETYPQHRHKQRFEAFQEWTGQRLESRADELIATLEAQKAGPDWTADGGKWVPYPHRYLAKRRYEDAPLPTSPDAPGECANCHEPTRPGHTHCDFCEKRGRSGQTPEERTS
jgi:hypothetical protein